LGGLLALAVAAIFAEHFPASVLPNVLPVAASAVRAKWPVVIGFKVVVVHGWSMKK
jgi:hypothetical protein